MALDRCGLLAAVDLPAKDTVNAFKIWLIRCFPRGAVARRFPAMPRALRPPLPKGEVDRILRCDPGEGLQSVVRADPPSPASHLTMRGDLPPAGRGEETKRRGPPRR